MPTIRELKPGQTVRITFAADHWIDVTNDGECVRVSSPRGVRLIENEPNWLTVFTRDEIEADELVVS